jgi:hypothetical protein
MHDVCRSRINSIFSTLHFDRIFKPQLFLRNKKAQIWTYKIRENIVLEFCFGSNDA